MALWLTLPTDWRRPGEPGHRAWWCEPDGYGRIWPVPDPARLAAAYDLDSYYTHGSPGVAPHSRDLDRRILEHLAFRLDRSEWLDADRLVASFPSGSASICDLGCGDGTLLAGLTGGDFALYGVEPDSVARDTARARGIRVQAGTAEQPPEDMPWGTCDAVILQHALEHCVEPGLALHAARRLVKPDGILFCEVPNHASLGARLLGACWHWLDVPRHLHFFTPASLRATVERAGWRVERTVFNGYARQFEPGWLAAERAIRSVFAAHGMAAPPERPWHLFLRTAFASSEARYDSVRVEARPA